MACTINASATNGIVQTADGSGVLQLQSAGTTVATVGSAGLVSTTTAKAWVNFNGTGTVAIRSSYNVSSITDNGTGDYTVNFTNALSDVNYVPNINYSPIYATYYPQGARVFSTGATLLESAPTVSGFRFSTGFVTGNEQDPKYVLVSVLGN